MVSISNLLKPTQKNYVVVKIYFLNVLGGPAEVLDWRYESCTGEGTCKIPSDGKKRLCHFTFVPSEPIPGGIFIRFNVTAADIPSRIYDIPVPDSGVRGGRLYTLETADNPTLEFQGKTMTFQYIIIRQEDNLVEACAETEYENV